MRLPAILIISPDDIWRRNVAGRLLTADCLAYCATGTPEAIRFLDAGIAPALIVLDARFREDATSFLSEQQREPSLRQFSVLAVETSSTDELRPGAAERGWLYTSQVNLDQTVLAAIGLIRRAQT